MQSIVDPLNGLRGIGRYIILPSEAKLSTDYFFVPSLVQDVFFIHPYIILMLIPYYFDQGLQTTQKTSLFPSKDVMTPPSPLCVNIR